MNRHCFGDKLKVMSKILIMILLLNFLSSCTTFYKHYPFKQKRELSSVQKRIYDAVQASPKLSMRTIGDVNYGDFSAPVWSVSYRSDGAANYSVFISAAIHGNEPAGTESIVRLIEELSKENKQYPSIALDFIPIINPWGWTRNVRYNREGIDVSREFDSIASQESLLLKKYLSQKTYDLMISHHEDGRDKGFYILTYENEDLSISEKLGQSIKEAGYPLRLWKGQVGYIHITGKASEKKINQTFMQYARKHHSNNVYIIESIYTMPFEDRLRQYSISHDVLLSSLFGNSL